MKNAVVLGTFDGLHIGHRRVIEQAAGYNITAVTFKIPPKFAATENALLMMPEERRNGLRKLGVCQVEALDFNSVCDIEAEDFLCSVTEKFAPKLLVCGFNYRFGKGAVGNTEMLARYCSENGIDFKCVQPVTQNGVTVSSSMIRDMIRCGDSSAFGMVYGGFSFTAPVINGNHRGRTIGFPTINQKYPEGLVLPKFGVYAVKVCFDGKAYKGVANIGHRPTYHTKEVFSETFIKDFSGDVYGKTVTVKPIEFLREERKFSSLEELKNAIRADVDRAN